LGIRKLEIEELKAPHGQTGGGLARTGCPCAENYGQMKNIPPLPANAANRLLGAGIADVSKDECFQLRSGGRDRYPAAFLFWEHKTLNIQIITGCALRQPKHSVPDSFTIKNISS